MTGTPFVCGIRPNSFEPVINSGTCTATDQPVTIEKTDRITVTTVDQARSGQKDLTEATIIRTGGRPMESAENFKILVPDS